jgi:hypothetical protein
MQLGFETIGNATLIAYDGRPVLATDPWIAGSPYFGSWGMSHTIPEQQLAAITHADYIWFSHGHPDHLNGDSLALLRDRDILLPAHVGGRIRDDLQGQGHKVRELPIAEWVQLSDRIRVMCLPDYNQDATLLVEIGDALVVNGNDASAPEWMPLITRLIRNYKRSFLLCLTGYGDADMINFFDEAGNRIPPPALKRKQAGRPVGPSVARLAESYGVTHFVPFSSMHTYQREDSDWANECSTPIGAHAEGFDSTRCSILPAFVHYDLLADKATAINPPQTRPVLHSPKDFGDDWSETLDGDEVQLATRYFRSIEQLSKFLDFVNLRVGGRDHAIAISKKKFNRGVTFEAPRHSLVTALQYEIFDDLLIGNFMKTTLHGKWPATQLYPDFAPYVAKYADNGRARNADELRTYFAEYRRRAGIFPFVRHRLSAKASQAVRAAIPYDSTAWRVARRTHSMISGLARSYSGA